MRKTSINTEEWHEALRIANTATEDKVPPGWFTQAQLAKIWQRGVAQTNRYVATLRQANMLEMRAYRIRCGDKGICSIKHYRLKK